MSKTTRLTRVMRQAILDKAVPPAFKPRHEALTAAMTTWADALYDWAYGEVLKTAEKLPRYWLQWDNSICFENQRHEWCEPRYIRTDVEYHGDFVMSKEHPFPIHGKIKLPEEPSHFLNKELRRLRKVREQLEQAEVDARSALRQLLDAHRTVEALLDAWPEGATYVPPQPAPQFPLAVVGLASKVNKMLGIDAQTVIGKAMQR